MKHFDWNAEKNELLKEERGVSFEEIQAAAESNEPIAVIDHPNQSRYPNQKIMIVNINEYAYMVPFVDNKDSWFLKTIYPSRDATKIFIKKEKV